VSRAAALAAALAALLLAACGSGGERIETGGLATTTSAATVAELPPPEGPLDELVADRIGALELGEELGSGTVRELGAEDARDLSYEGPGGRSAVVTISLWPSPQRAQAYARKVARVLASDQGFEVSAGPDPFAGRTGGGTLTLLSDGAGTEAGVWTAGRHAVDALADRDSLETLLERAPFGREGGA
jgi:hypothetical protein